MSSVSKQVVPGLGGVPETLLIPLWARAQEQLRAQPLIRDDHSARILAALNYNFDAFRLKHVEAENFCVRACVMDHLITHILNQSPGRSVVEFGPGLDMRANRVGRNAHSWLEVDLPEVISLRERFLPADENRSMLASSMLDEKWMDQVQLQSSQPPLFIAEGVFYFFSREQIRSFLLRLSTRFPGSSLVFDAVSSWYLQMANWRHPLSTSKLQFCLNSHAAEINQWNSRFRVQDYIGFGDSPIYDSLMHRFPLWKRVMRRCVPFSRHAFMVVHVQFSGSEYQP